MVFGNPKYKHTFTFVPDLARAVVAVAEAGESAWGRAWHCPNAPAEPMTDVVQKAARACENTKPPTIWTISVSGALLAALISCRFQWIMPGQKAVDRLHGNLVDVSQSASCAREICAVARLA